MDHFLADKPAGSCVKVNSKVRQSKAFEEGFFKGQLCSTLLFVIYINDLLIQVGHSNLMSVYDSHQAFACSGGSKMEVTKK